MTILFETTGKGKLDCVRIVPPIPFVKPTKKQVSEEECHTCKSRSSPTSEELPTCNLAVPHFSAGTCEEYLTFLKNFEKVKKGQNIVSGAKCKQVRPCEMFVRRGGIDGIRPSS